MPNSLHHDIFDNVLLTPWQRVTIDDQKFVRGGLAFPSKFPSFARYHVHERIGDTNKRQVPQKTEKLSGRYIWGGHYWSHFGHFLAECVHRLWITRDPAYRECPVLFAAHQHDHVEEPFFRETMALLGIRNWRFIQAATHVDELVIAEQGKYLSAPAKQGYLPHLSDLVERNQIQGKSKASKVCVLRGHLKAGRSALEADLEKILVDDGYLAFRPEDHTLIDQLATFYNAKQLIISEGSALHICDLLPKIDAQVGVLNRRGGDRLAITTLKGKADRLSVFGNVGVAFVPQTGNVRDPSKAYSFMDMHQTLENLESAGFLSSLPTAIPDGYQEDFASFLAAQGMDNGTNAMVKNLLSELARRYRAQRNLSLENVKLKAELALERKEFDQARRHIQQYRWMNLDDDFSTAFQNHLESQIPAPKQIKTRKAPDQ